MVMTLKQWKINFFKRSFKSRINFNHKNRIYDFRDNRFYRPVVSFENESDCMGNLTIFIRENHLQKSSKISEATFPDLISFYRSI